MVKSKHQMPSPELLLECLAAWMVSKNIILASQPEDIDLSDNALLEKLMMGIAAVFGSPGVFSLSGGAKAEKVKLVLDPFTKLSNLVGLKVPHGLFDDGQFLILVILADQLDWREINQRFDLFMELGPSAANLGLKYNLQSSPIFIYPLVVYFDSKKYRQQSPKLLAVGWRRSFARRVFLRASTISIPDGKVEFGEMQGVSRVAGQVWNKIGVKRVFSAFFAEDLEFVLSLADHLQIVGAQDGK